jgi:hypothetical protein
MSNSTMLNSFTSSALDYAFEYIKTPAPSPAPITLLVELKVDGETFFKDSLNEDNKPTKV